MGKANLVLLEIRQLEQGQLANCGESLLWAGNKLVREGPKDQLMFVVTVAWLPWRLYLKKR